MTHNKHNLKKIENLLSAAGLRTEDVPNMSDSQLSSVKIRGERITKAARTAFGRKAYLTADGEVHTEKTLPDNAVVVQEVIAYF